MGEDHDDQIFTTTNHDPWSQVTQTLDALGHDIQRLTADSDAKLHRMEEILEENEQTLAKQERLQAKNKREDDAIAAAQAKEKKLDEVLAENDKSIDELASAEFAKWKANFDNEQKEVERMMEVERPGLKSLERVTENPVAKELASRGGRCFVLWGSAGDVIGSCASACVC